MSTKSTYQHVLVLGGTGATGEALIKRLLSLGHYVTALVRTPSKLPEQPKLTVVQGDVLKADTIVKALDTKQECTAITAVLSCLGYHEQKPWQDTTFYTDSMSNVISAIGQSQAKPQRLVVMTSWGTYATGSEAERHASWTMWGMRKFLLGTLENMRAMEEYVIKEAPTHSLTYTIQHPPGLKTKPSPVPYTSSADEVLQAVSQRVLSSKTPYPQFRSDCGSAILRSDVADFMVSTLYSKEYDNTTLAIGAKDAP